MQFTSLAKNQKNKKKQKTKNKKKTKKKKMAIFRSSTEAMNINLHRTYQNVKGNEKLYSHEAVQELVRDNALCLSVPPDDLKRFLKTIEKISNIGDMHTYDFNSNVPHMKIRVVVTKTDEESYPYYYFGTRIRGVYSVLLHIQGNVQGA